jgi:hypothetical protein
MSRSDDEMPEKRGWRKAATGIWLYDWTVPMRTSTWAKPAHDASSRFDEDDQLDENKPIPKTKDGFLYCGWPGHCGEHLTLEEAKAVANAESWGPISWD